MGVAHLCTDTMRRNTHSTRSTATTNRRSPHPAIPNPVPSMGAVVTAVAVVGALLLTLQYPTAMLAAAVTAGVTYAIARTVAGGSRPEIPVPGTDRGVRLRSTRE